MEKFLTGILVALFSVSSLGATLAPIQMINPTGSTSGQAVVSTGASTAPGWSSIVDSVLAGSGVAVSGATGNVTVSLAQIGANTLLGNATGSTANVAAVAVTGCNGAAQALQWTNGSGFGCNSSVATSGANANITSLTGITTPIPVSEGGTGAATLTSHGVLIGEGTSAVGQIAAGTTGQVLVGSTGANPAFGTTVAGLTFSSAITPQSTGGIVGTTAGDNANAGSIGEYPSPTDLSGVSLTSGTPVTVSSITLPAGDWEIQAVVQYAPGSGTVISSAIASVSPTNNATGGFPNTTAVGFTGAANAGQQLASPMVRENVTTSTTFYAIANATFTTSTCTANGHLHVRRVR